MGRGGEGGVRVPTSDPHTINACWFLFLLFAYLLVAEAASFDKKELCRSDTTIMTINYNQLIMKKKIVNVPIRLTAPHNIYEMLNMTLKTGSWNRSKSSCYIGTV